MEVDYSDHALENIEDRKIPKHLIENALNNPDEVVEGRKGRKISHKIVGNKLLRA